MKIAGEWGLTPHRRGKLFQVRQRGQLLDEPLERSSPYINGKWTPKAQVAQAVKRSGKRTGEKSNLSDT